MNALIVTLELDPALATRLTEWRTRYFPSDRNYLGAHVTLFHALPGERLDDVSRDLSAEATTTLGFAVRVPGPFSLGRGVALDVVADEIKPLRTRLRALWLPHLTPQDQTPTKRAHATIQNKVTPEDARRTLDEVRATWDPATAGRAIGLALWEYRGGPWEPLRTFHFEG